MPRARDPRFDFRLVSLRVIEFVSTRLLTGDVKNSRPDARTTKFVRATVRSRERRCFFANKILLVRGRNDAASNENMHRLKETRSSRFLRKNSTGTVFRRKQIFRKHFGSRSARRSISSRAARAHAVGRLDATELKIKRSEP